MSSYPFVYIAALMRTGSTMLSEALTRLPDSYIFYEPHLGKNFWRIHEQEVQALTPYGIDLESFARWRLRLAFLLRRMRRFGYRQDFMLREFKAHIAQNMFPNKPAQIGVKEVRNWGWENYLRVFPDMKVIVTGRDPRDIYISAVKKNQRDGTLEKYGPVTPENIALQLNKEFVEQLKISDSADSLAINYETICTDPLALNRVREFVGSPLSAIGQIGGLLEHHPQRKVENKKHGKAISAKSIEAWRHETDAKLVEGGHKVVELMPDYCAFWGYEAT